MKLQYVAYLGIGLAAVVACKAKQAGGPDSVVKDDGANPGEGGGAAGLYNPPPLSNEQQRINAEWTPQVIAKAQEIVQWSYDKAEADSKQRRPDSGWDHRLRANRDTHAKTHGCLKGEFKIHPNIQPEAAVGLFADKNKVYKTLARFANGRSGIEHDKESDARGMAVKFLDVDGAPRAAELWSGEQSRTFDFVTNNGPVFLVKDIKEYFDFQVAAFEAKKGSKVATAKFIASWFMRLKPTTSRNAESPVSEPYYSGNALRWGSNVAKYRFMPCRGVKDRVGTPDDPNFLRTNMVRDVEAQGTRKEVCYNMYVDFLDTSRMDQQKVSALIEDMTLDWTNEPVRTAIIGTMTFPPQRFSADQLLDACDNLSFNTWRTTAEHIPVGALATIRRDVYTAVSDLRHKLNAKGDQALARKMVEEPTVEDFEPIGF